MRGTKYLSEVMENIELSKDENNLLLAPIGCGKTYYAIKVLMNNPDKKYLYLCDNNNLKDQMLKELPTYSSNKNSIIFEDIQNVLVMTYKEFGHKILYDVNEDFASQFDLIIADEIHSCIEYSEFNQDRDLSSALFYLFRKHLGTPIIMMTATDYYLELMTRKYPQLKNFNVINLLGNKEIRRYIDKVKLYINNISQIKFYLQQSWEGFMFGGMKAGIYTRQIRDMQNIEKMCIDLGLVPICVWSRNNEKYPLNEEQIDFMDKLLKTGKIKEPYNVFIFNKSSETGINITDENVDLCIVNSISQTEQIQARGRFRKDLNLIVVKTKEKALPPMTVTLDEKYLLKWIPVKEIHELIKELNLTNGKGKKIGLNPFVKILNESNYVVIKQRKSIKNVRDTYYFIHKA
ncbi:MAG: DEAD/DEAH box helicase family protein [Clostridia bacterium]